MEKISLPTRQQLTLLGSSLLVMGTSQALLGMGREFINAQRPIDWAHWLLLIGAVGAASSVAKMKAGKLGTFATIVILIGAIAFIGMSAIDILLWTLPPHEVVDKAISEALRTPGIAIPFLWVGPSLFFIGLALKSLEWRKISIVGVTLLVLGTFVSGYGQGIGNRWLVVISFVMMLLGLLGVMIKKSLPSK